MLLFRNDPLWRDLDTLMDTLTGPTLDGLRFSGDHGLRWLRERQLPEPAWQDRGEVMALDLEVPGVDPHDIEVEVLGRTLTVKARREVSVPEGYKALRRERSPWEWSRSWTLADTIDADAIAAQLDNGVFTITAPKRERPGPRRIQVTKNVPQIEMKEEE